MIIIRKIRTGVHIISGWRNITNIDISANGLKRLQARDRQSSYLIMDMTKMPLKDHSFDIIIEKVNKYFYIKGLYFANGWGMVREKMKAVGKNIKGEGKGLNVLKCIFLGYKIKKSSAITDGKKLSNCEKYTSGFD